MKDSLSFLVLSLLHKHKINLDTKEFDFQIKSHPSYPSLHSITGVLSHFKVDNLALKVPNDEETITQLPNCFLAQVNTEKGTFFSIVNREKEKFYLTLDISEKQVLSLSEFQKKFTGILVAIDNEDSKNPKAIKETYYSKAVYLSIIVLFFILFFYAKPNFISALHFLLSITGLSISILIIKHNLGMDSKIVDSICSKESKNTNCDNVLKSNGSKIFNVLKLSDASLIFFTSLCMSWLMISLTNSQSEALFLISLFTIPLVVYSLYYQKFIAKSWCILCLGIVLVLVAQILLSLLNSTFKFNLSQLTLIITAFSFLLVSSIWLFVVNKLENVVAYNKLKIEAIKFKRNFNLFKSLLYNKSTLEYNIPKVQEITFGNKLALLNITIITNPFCGHCKAVHNLIESILEQYHQQICIIVRFNIDTTKETSDVVKITSRLLEIYYHDGEIDCLNAMHDIYNDLSSDKWLAKYGTCTNIEPYLNILLTESNWCKTHNINFTPEILLNGRSFPSEYNREDLIYFIEDLAENCNETSPLNTTIKQYSE